MVDTLKNLRALLAQHKVEAWVSKLDEVLTVPHTGDRAALKNAVLQMYRGTMGSLTDLIVNRVNGDDVDDEQTANETLERLRHELWLAAKQL